MHKLSESIDRKFIESFDASEWEVECENGYVDVLSSNKTIKYEIYRIQCENGLFLECADNHIIINENHDEIFAKDSFGCNILTKYGKSRVISVEATGVYENMYDLSIDSKEHTYYTNDILSHNTTTSVAYILWYTLFQSHKNVAILANKSGTARGILSRYQLMYENLPKWMQQGVVNWNKGDIELENGSRVFTAATTAAGIRSQSVNLLYIDEAAIIPNNVADAFFTSVYPVVSAGKTTKIIITSTPLGYNHFWKFWNDAENGRNDFIPLFIPYFEIPGRDENWLEEQKRQLGELKFNQEVLCKFLGSSATLINADTISKMSIEIPIYSSDGLDIYREPEKEHLYITTVDTARGVGGDYSTFSVFDITEVPYRVVAKYRNNTISPLLFPSVIHQVCKKYNDSYCLIELNVNEQVAYIMHTELEYENLMFTSKVKNNQALSNGFGGSLLRPGVFMDKKVKRIGCQNLKSIVEQNKLLITDADTISEISTFIEDKGSFNADEGYNDDLVINLVLFAWVATTPYFKELNNIDIRKALYEAKMKEIEESMTPFGLLDDGHPEALIRNADNFTKFLLDMN